MDPIGLERIRTIKQELGFAQLGVRSPLAENGRLATKDYRLFIRYIQLINSKEYFL